MTDLEAKDRLRRIKNRGVLIELDNDIEAIDIGIKSIDKQIDTIKILEEIRCNIIKEIIKNENISTEDKGFIFKKVDSVFYIKEQEIMENCI